MRAFILAVLVILPVPKPPSSLDLWRAELAQTGALTLDLLDEYRELTFAPSRWRPLIARHFPEAQVHKAMRVMRCESGGNPDAKNRSSTAAGLFQFLKSTWNRVARETGSPAYRDGVYDPVWSVVNAAWLWEHGGWRQWSCG